MTVLVKLRSVIKDKGECLAMYDSNGHGDINNLETEVHAGESITWKLDEDPRIKEIVKIWSREKISNIFTEELTRENQKKNEFTLHISEDAKEGLEAYNIECLLVKDTRLIIDPYIRILPPDTH